MVFSPSISKSNSYQPRRLSSTLPPHSSRVHLGSEQPPQPSLDFVHNPPSPAFYQVNVLPLLIRLFLFAVSFPFLDLYLHLFVLPLRIQLCVMLTLHVHLSIPSASLYIVKVTFSVDPLHVHLCPKGYSSR